MRRFFNDKVLEKIGDDIMKDRSGDPMSALIAIAAEESGYSTTDIAHELNERGWVELPEGFRIEKQVKNELWCWLGDFFFYDFGRWDIKTGKPNSKGEKTYLTRKWMLNRFVRDYKIWKDYWDKKEKGLD